MMKRVPGRFGGPPIVPHLLEMKMIVPWRERVVRSRAVHGYRERSRNKWRLENRLTASSLEAVSFDTKFPDR